MAISTDSKKSPTSMVSARSTRSAVAMLALGTLATACARPSHQPPGASASDPEAAAIARARADSSRYPYTAADIGFMSAMIAHHAQAVTMSALAPTRAASNSVKILAERITNSQQDEIALAEQWLRDRGKPTSHDMSAHSDHEMPMPGMLTAAQLAELKEATGPRFDRLFLTFMIQHHRGSAAMVNDLFATDGAAQDETVFRFATDVNVDQVTEIARMQQILTTVTSGQDR